MKAITLPILSLFLLSVTTTQATTIVDLSEALARFDSLTDNDSGVGGYASGNPSAAAHAAGLVFNVTFTPAAGDLNSATAPVSLVEVGGDVNGTGLYLLNGELHFISKMSSNVNTSPGPFDDLDWDGGIVGVSSFGTLTAGTEYSVAAIFDPITSASLRLAIVPTGSGASIDNFALVNRGSRTNWSGDDSASAFRGVDIGNFGGAKQGSGVWSEASINSNPFEGTQGQALYWSGQSANFTVPDTSSSLALMAIGVLANLFGLSWARRGKK